MIGGRRGRLSSADGRPVRARVFLSGEYGADVLRPTLVREVWIVAKVVFGVSFLRESLDSSSVAVTALAMGVGGSRSGLVMRATRTVTNSTSSRYLPAASRPVAFSPRGARSRRSCRLWSGLMRASVNEARSTTFAAVAMVPLLGAISLLGGHPPLVLRKMRANESWPRHERDREHSQRHAHAFVRAWGIVVPRSSREELARWLVRRVSLRSRFSVLRADSDARRRTTCGRARCGSRQVGVLAEHDLLER